MYSIYIYINIYLVGGWATRLKNTSPIGSYPKVGLEKNM